MAVPFEGLLPWTIMAAFFGLAGHGTQFVRYWDNGWKNDRWNLDAFDEKMLKRDFLLTGVKRGQQSDAVAPESFKTEQPQLEQYWTNNRNQFFRLRERLFKGYATGV